MTDLTRRSLTLAAAASALPLGAAAQSSLVTVTAAPNRVVRDVPPGVVGWGAMWKRDMLWPAPPAEFTDQSHLDYIIRLGETNAPLIAAADVRNISWPWGVTFSTWAVNWENSAQPWSRRTQDCARFLNRTSPWCETTVVGVGDLMTLAHIWNLEAITVSVPLAVIDGSRTRWGPGFFDQVFSPDVIEKISDHANLLVDYMKFHATWQRLERIYIAAGCEWRHYKLRNPSPAVLSYAALIKRIREKITDEKVIIVASASDSADLPGLEREQANSWNRYLYEELNGMPGVAMDLHRYRGMIGADRAPDGTMPLTPANIDRLLRTGVTQRGYLTVQPEQWGGSGPAIPSVLFENAIHGVDGDHSRTSNAPRPWPATMAHADLVREALASDAMSFLGWTWFPEALPREWPHGAVKNGALEPHAYAQAFLSRPHRDTFVAVTSSDEATVRAVASRGFSGGIAVTGGNFSQRSVDVRFDLPGRPAVTLLTEQGERAVRASAGGTVTLPPMSLFSVET
jgi:hypothetical protein